MSKNIPPPLKENETMSSSEHFRRFKRWRLFFEPSIGFLGFFLVGLVLVCVFFYMDYRAVPKGFGFTGKSEKFLWLRDNLSHRSHNKAAFLEVENSCDVFEGQWVWDESYPLYNSKDCPFMDEGFRCSENGRPDLLYTKWRWQPKDCNLPRFDARLMLEKIRNKRVVFAGDSIGRNQWESLLCMLSSEVQNKSSIYEVNGSPITKHKGYLVFKFREFNCTVEYYRAPFLVLQSRPPAGSPAKIRTTLKVDRMDWNAGKWKTADVLILNTGHWWNYEKTIRGGCYFQEGGEVKSSMKVAEAYRKSIMKVAQWIRFEIDTNRTQVFFRTFAPVHFRGGDWRTGGACHLETLPELGTSFVPPETWSQSRIVTDVLSLYANSSEPIHLNVLNITRMSAQRKDGHSSRFYLGNNRSPAPINRQDCSHWCLPGVPDSWNELVYAFFLKREAARIANMLINRMQA